MSCEDYPRVKVGPENPLRVEKGTPAKLTCNVDSKPAVSSVKWTRNGRFSETSFTYTIPQVSIQVCLLRRKNINMYSTDIHTFYFFSKMAIFPVIIVTTAIVVVIIIVFYSSNPKWKTTCFQMFKFSCHCSLCNAIKWLVLLWLGFVFGFLKLRWAADADAFISRQFHQSNNLAFSLDFFWG